MGHTPTIWQTEKEEKMLAIEWRKDYLIEKHNQVRQAIQRAQDLLQKWNIWKKGRQAYEPFKEGDQVWLDGKNLKTSHPFAKLAPKWYSLFPVVQVINPVVFKLKLPDQWYQKHVHPVFHVSLLSPYKEMEENGQAFTEPAPDVIEGEEKYEVEQVLDSRWKGRGKGHLEYFLKWEGYLHAHNTWEPADQVHADDLVEEFHKQNPTKAKKIIIRWGRMGNEQCSFAPSFANPPSPPTVSMSSSQSDKSTLPTFTTASTNTSVGRPSVPPITNSPVISLPYTWKKIQSVNLDLLLPQIIWALQADADFFNPHGKHHTSPNSLVVDYWQVQLVCLGIPYDWPVGHESNYEWPYNPYKYYEDTRQCPHCLFNFKWRRDHPGTQRCTHVFTDGHSTMVAQRLGDFARPETPEEEWLEEDDEGQLRINLLRAPTIPAIVVAQTDG
jgi:Chromo (CHRromatin Organisation MOdifier) domain